MSPIASVPSPPAFLDPLTDVESCYYYAVPKFFGQNHPSTRWLITMIKNGEDDRLKHKMETSPYAFKGVYYQMMDYPQMFIPEDVAATPMFKRQAVAYFTPLGMAIYLGKADMVELLLTFKDVYNDPICDPNEPQFATHLQDNEAGDFHAFPPFVVMLRRSCFGCVQPLLRSGWDPSKPVAMPMRRKFERRVLYFRDWLEVALSVLATRPMYHLQVVVREMIKGTAYTPIKMPLTELLPENPAEAGPIGLMDVDLLPPGVPMIGVRSLLDMAEHYDRYLQIRHCAKQVSDLKREAVAVGLNPEVLMIQAQDFDGGALGPEEQTEGSNAVRGANNSSAVEDRAAPQVPHVMNLDVNMSAAKKKKDSGDSQYASEGCRILHFALMRDPTGKSMQTCIEAFCVLLRRGFYLQAAKPAVMSSLARDTRNTAILLLNLVQREQSKVDAFVEKIKSGVKRFAHLEEHKQLESRKTACIQFISKLVAVLTKLLLHAKMLIDFIHSDYPPYHPYFANVKLNPYLVQNFQDIKLGIIREFNLTKDAWVFLDKEMLKTVSGMPEMQLHMRVGKKPTNLPRSAAAKQAANKNKSNMINTNSCFVSYTRVQRRPKPTLRARVAYTSPPVTSASSSAAPSIAASRMTAHLLQDGEDSSVDCLPMDSSAEHVTNCTSEVLANPSDVGDMKDFSACGKNTDYSACPDGLTKQPGATEATSEVITTMGDCSKMELLLANLCREVDSLFRPLEDGSCDGKAPWVEAAGAAKAGQTAATRSTNGAAAGLLECSTIELELASTPVPTPQPSPTPNPAGTADIEAATLDCSQVPSRRPQPQLPPGLRKKLKQSGVLHRLMARRQPAKDCKAATAHASS